MKADKEVNRTVHAAAVEWGEVPDDHYGYASDAERLELRGMDDWELVEHIPKSQKRIPTWFYAVILGVLIMAFGLSLPFWGDRPGHPRPWLTMGHVYALMYIIVAGSLVYFMTTLYGSERGGSLDSEMEDTEVEGDAHDAIAVNMVNISAVEVSEQTIKAGHK